MLTLTRKAGQAVVIDGGRLIVTVSDVDRGKVQLSFACDRSVVVDREEVHERKLAEAKQGRATAVPAAA